MTNVCFYLRHSTAWCKAHDSGTRSSLPYLRRLDSRGRNADLCLVIKRGPNGIVMASVYMDDNFCVGHKQALAKLIEDLKEHGLLVKVTEDMTDYLSCNIVFLQDGKSMWIGQPHLIWKIEEKFGSMGERSTDLCYTRNTRPAYGMACDCYHRDNGKNAPVPISCGNPNCSY